MMTRFVVDGEVRLRQSPQFQARLGELYKLVRARHAANYVAGGFFRGILLRWRVTVDFMRERRRIEPSSQSLYSRKIGSGRL